MNDFVSLRRELRALAFEDAPGPVATGAVIGAAVGMRRRRRATLAATLTVAGLLLAGAMRSPGQEQGLVVTPGPTPTSSPPVPQSASASPSPSASPPAGRPPRPAAGSPTATTGPAVDPSAEPSLSPTGEPPPPRVCNLLVDVADDASPPTGARALDVLSADVATGQKLVTAVLRLGSLDDVPADGATWSFSWMLGTQTYRVETEQSPAGRTSRLVVGGQQSTATPTVTVDAATRQVRWQVFRGAVPDLAQTATFHSLSAATARGTGATAVQSDAASSSATYEDRTPSCVKSA